MDKNDIILTSIILINVTFVMGFLFFGGMLIGGVVAGNDLKESYNDGFSSGENKSRYEMYLDLQSRGIGEYDPHSKEFYFDPEFVPAE
jgi:hypothetical protein